MDTFEKEQHVKVTFFMVVGGPVENVRPVVKLYLMVLPTELILPPVVGTPNFYFNQMIHIHVLERPKMV